MIANDISFVKDYISKFKVKFNNFVKNLPIKVYYFITNNDIKILYGKKEVLKYTINFAIDIKENIKKLKDLLYVYFPIMEEIKIFEFDYTAKELSLLVESGKASINDIDSLKKIRKEKYNYVIEKVNIKKDQVLVKNLNEGIYMLFKIKMPVTIFLRKIESLNNSESWEFFKERTLFLKKIS